MAMQQYCLRWNNHQPNFISVFSSLLSNESLVDVTLAAEGKHLQAHKVVLSACSSYFQSLFTVNPCQHPIVILKDVKFIDLKIMVDFMYYGEVNVSQEQLPYILKTAEMLKIKGLAEIPMEQTINKTTSMDKTELLTAQDSNWSSDGMPLQTSTPSPCSPGSRRKRLRKSSSGSGSGERQEPVIEPPQNELILSQNILSSVIKSDPGGYPDNSVTQKSRDSTDLQRGGSHESVEGDTLHQITLQVPQHQQHQQDVALQHSIESQSTSSEIPGTSSNVQHQPSQPITGLHWNVMDQNFYPPPCQTHLHNDATQTTQQNPNQQQQQQHCQNDLGQGTQNPQSPDCFPGQIGNSPPQIIQKRKRSVNPQSDENFIKALEAVRFGGIGFCKAARMYGVNNRTLWLEYKKRGYPNFRLSIKNRKQENSTPQDQSSPPEIVQGIGVQEAPLFVKQEQMYSGKIPSEENHNHHHQDQIICTASAGGGGTHPIALIGTTFFDGKPMDLGPVLHRPKYLDAATAMASSQALNFQSINFEQM
ncbi:longitudinals lacking protein, isoforms H/M/V-like isoform X3 [Sitophilus oryzae]|uniref:Longitudinals lacking protein, isoforms H/M/V-like isoform X3 n=1 Tax=Sitophilus oryzae TaxID=7048 RepID=A0A6J2XRB9_SITOR|nr:longitudinals lacking protein, isoforms H/M/V-like isoform X3 [Sitophilus oryzae]